MLIIEKETTYGWEAAIRGMRNPMNSWDKSDSCFCPSSPECEGNCTMHIGENDLDLMQRLVKSGSDHSKFMRMITVTMDITAPLYWWKEFDTYKVGTVANSCSTMHKIHARDLTLDDFSVEDLSDSNRWMMQQLVEQINVARHKYAASKEKYYWRQMIQMLPSSFNQKRTVQLNYAVLRNIYFARRSHKLYEWCQFCDQIAKLPHAAQLITLEF